MTSFRAAIFAILLQIAAPQLPPGAALRGTIRMSGSGEPIAGAVVELRRNNNGYTLMYPALTSGDGSFRLDNIQPGEYRLFARRTGYIPSEYGQHRSNGAGVPFNVVAGQLMEEVDVYLKAAGSISGHITDRNGDALPAAGVLALTQSYRTGQRILEVVQSSFTNDLGEYRLFGLPPGKYYVSATPSGGSVSGTAASRQPAFLNVAGSSVYSNSLDGLVGGATQSSIYYPGTSDVRSASAIDLMAGANVAGNNFSIVPAPLLHVRGRVGGSGANLTLIPLSPVTGSFRATRILDASTGAFDFADVAPGDYLLTAQSVDMEARVRVNVRDTDVNNVSAELRAGVLIPTHVTIEGHVPADNDPDYRFVRFNLIPDPPIQGIAGAKYITFPNGAVNFDVTVGESYRITLVSIPDAPPEYQNIYIQSIRMGARDILNNGFQYNGEPDARIEIVVGTRPGSVSGVVLNDRGKPPINTANATVVLIPEMERRGRLDAFKVATTGIDGGFQFPVVPPGDYKVFSWAEVEDGEWLDPQFMLRYEDRGTPIHIDAAGKSVLNLTLIP